MGKTTSLIARYQRLSAWTRVCRGGGGGGELVLSRSRHDDARHATGGNGDHGDHGGPLTGVTVLDLGQVVSGNFCGMLLGYFGAHVIKVEPPQKGCVVHTCADVQHTAH